MPVWQKGERKGSFKVKFFDLTTLNRDNSPTMKAALSVTCVIVLCALGMIGISALIDAQTKADLQKKNDRLSSLASDASSASASVSEEEETSASFSETTPETTESYVGPATSATESSETSSSSETSASSAASSETTETTKQTVTEKEYYDQVYAIGNMNVRSGPGTDYDIVKTLDYGDAIDVVAETDNGWYRTYNGNYVYIVLTQKDPVIVATPTPVPQQTSQTSQTTTAATTTQATTQATTRATEAPSNGNIDGMKYYGVCRITFYGPQANGDGSYSTATATGATCSEGRTIAADWSIFPAGTIIYIPNDPLGGDGYYTVEDRGSGVNGDHIDIYAEAGESMSTTSAEVYIVS